MVGWPRGNKQTIFISTVPVLCCSNSWTPTGHAIQHEPTCAKTSHKQTAMKESWALPRKMQLTSTISWTNTVTAKQRRFIDIAVLRLIGKRLSSHWRHEENSVKITSRAVKLGEGASKRPCVSAHGYISIQWCSKVSPQRERFFTDIYILRVCQKSWKGMEKWVTVWFQWFLWDESHHVGKDSCTLFLLRCRRLWFSRFCGKGLPDICTCRCSNFFATQKPRHISWCLSHSNSQFFYCSMSLGYFFLYNFLHHSYINFLHDVEQNTIHFNHLQRSIYIYNLKSTINFWHDVEQITIYYNHLQRSMYTTWSPSSISDMMKNKILYIIAICSVAYI